MEIGGMRVIVSNGLWDWNMLRMANEYDLLIKSITFFLHSTCFVVRKNRKPFAPSNT